MMRTGPVSARVLDAAIAWQLALDSGDQGHAEKTEFNAWYAADEEHARAWMQLGMLDQRFTAAAGPARRVLQQSRLGLRQHVRKLGRGLASVVLVGGLTLFVGPRVLPLDYWLADQRTATGEQRELQLADGTRIKLNTHSAIDIRYDGRQRLIVLRSGEILVETGHKGNDQRPFVVQTEDGTLRALGTRFLVRDEDQGTLLGVLQSAVAARPKGGNNESVLHEGQQVLMQRGALGTIAALSPGADAWTRGMLVVDNARLADVVSEISRYRPGHLGTSAEVAELRITGTFPLHNTDLALKALMPTLPVEIEQRSSWWTSVQARKKL